MLIIIFGRTVCVVHANLRVFQIDINKLIFLIRHVFLNKVADSLAETNFVVKTTWSDQAAWSLVVIGKSNSRSIGIHISVKFSYLYLFNVLVAGSLKNNQLMSNYSICYFLFFGCINLEWFTNLMHLDFTAVLWICIDIEN